MEQCEEWLPVLTEVKNKNIKNDPSGRENILIEGDNYHALSVLNYTHRGKIDVIYIDPPYNRGKDFMYNDKLVDEQDGYKHSKWLSFMNKRLQLAKKCISRKGLIFISIDDTEQEQLKMLCNEIFGEGNFIASIIWQKKQSPQNDAKYFSDMHDFILVYVKQINRGGSDEGWKKNLLPRTERAIDRYKNPDNDPRGVWSSGGLDVKTYSAEYDYPIITPSGRKVIPPSGSCWRVGSERFQEWVKDNRIWFGKNGDNVPRIKRFLSDTQQGMVPTTWWDRKFAGDNQEAKQELKRILTEQSDMFDTPKPLRLIKRVLQIASHKDSIILDFFAGSGTTGHAVLEMNKEDGGNRQFILCTDNENDICTNVCHPRLENVMNGYSFTGTERKELYKKKLTVTSLKGITSIFSKMDEIKESHADQFD